MAPTSLALKTDETEDLTATLSPAAAMGTVSWGSDKKGKGKGRSPPRRGPRPFPGGRLI